MIEVMIAEEGLGLAATQFGVAKRNGPRAFVNPRVIAKSKEDFEECLSILGALGAVVRHTWIKITHDKAREVSQRLQHGCTLCAT